MAECPFCKEKVGANDFLPSAEAACSVCGNRLDSASAAEPWWVSASQLAPTETKAAAPTPSAEPWWTASDSPEPKRPVITQLAPPQPTLLPPPDEPQPAPTASAPPPPILPPPRAAPDKSRPPPPSVSVEDEEPSSWLERLRSLDFGSALALLCFSAALLFGSFYTLEPFIKPTAALGLLAGLLGGALPALWRRKSAVLPILISIMCLMALLFVGDWPRFSSEPPRLVAVPLKQKGMAAHQVVNEGEWVDAAANAVKLGDVRVEIAAVQIGPVELKRQSSVSTSAERYLTIRLRTSYEGVVFQQMPYRPWADHADSPSQHAPTLTDNQGRTYTQKTFAPDITVVGQVETDALNPGHQVKDVLVYPAPAGEVEQLRLLLPASAFGLAGEFRFQIPKSMIRGL